MLRYLTRWCADDFTPVEWANVVLQQMSKPTNQEAMALAKVLAADWEGRRHRGFDDMAYREWGFGVADMCHAEVNPEAIAEFLAYIEERTGVGPSAPEECLRLAKKLQAAFGGLRAF